jgi:hypothetical protein
VGFFDITLLATFHSVLFASVFAVPVSRDSEEFTRNQMTYIISIRHWKSHW